MTEDPRAVRGASACALGRSMFCQHRSGCWMENRLGDQQEQGDLLGGSRTEADVLLAQWRDGEK